ERSAEQERPLGTVVSRIGVGSIRSGFWLQRHQNLPLGEAFAKASDRFDTRRQELKLCSKQRAYDALAVELLPPALRLAVIHDEVGVAQLAGRAEAQGPPARAPIEYHRGIAERTPGHRDRGPAEGVVHDFMPNQDPKRIGTRLAAYLDRDDRLLGRQIP